MLGVQNLDTKRVLAASKETAGAVELKRKSGARISGGTATHLLHSGLWKQLYCNTWCS